MQVQKFEGTAAQFVAAGVTLNGVKLDQVAISIMVRHGVFEIVGDGPKPARGKTPKVFRVVSNPVLNIGVEAEDQTLFNFPNAAIEKVDAENAE